MHLFISTVVGHHYSQGSMPQYYGQQYGGYPYGQPAQPLQPPPYSQNAPGYPVNLPPPPQYAAVVTTS